MVTDVLVQVSFGRVEPVGIDSGEPSRVDPWRGRSGRRRRLLGRGVFGVFVGEDTAEFGEGVADAAFREAGVVV
ncbi:MAG: hypothetical protein L0K86_04570, partial [Actinomycetia bacterium]|nr:hypothetical protein [Actinomycetes bacterium]